MEDEEALYDRNAQCQEHQQEEQVVYSFGTPLTLTLPLPLPRWQRWRDGRAVHHIHRGISNTDHPCSTLPLNGERYRVETSSRI